MKHLYTRGGQPQGAAGTGTKLRLQYDPNRRDAEDRLKSNAEATTAPAPGLRCALAALLLAACLPQAQAAGTSLWSISGDPNNGFVPDLFSLVDNTSQTVNNIAPLGNGSLGFNGGVTVGPGNTLYAIANDSGLAGSLYTVQPSGATSLVGSAGGPGFGFLRRLPNHPLASTFYAPVDDP